MDRQEQGRPREGEADIAANGWKQAQLGIRAGGLGLRDPAVHAAGAYLASFRAAADLAARINRGSEDKVYPGFDPQDTHNHYGNSGSGGFGIGPGW